MQSRFLGVFVVVVLILVAISPGVAQRGAVTERVSVDLDVRPGEADGTFVLTARVKDLGTQLVLAAPHVVFNLGDEAYSASRLPTGEEIRLRIWVPPSKDQAEITAEIVRDGEVVFGSSTKLRTTDT